MLWRRLFCSVMCCPLSRYGVGLGRSSFDARLLFFRSADQSSQGPQNRLQHSFSSKNTGRNGATERLSNRTNGRPFQTRPPWQDIGQVRLDKLHVALRNVRRVNWRLQFVALVCQTFFQCSAIARRTTGSTLLGGDPNRRAASTVTIIPIWNTIARVEIAYLKKLAPSGDAATVLNTLPFSVFTPESNSSLAEKATFPEAHLEAEANTLTAVVK